MLKRGKNTGIFLRVWNNISTFACTYNRLQFFLFFPRARLFFSRTEGTSRRCLRFSLFLLPMGFTDRDPR